MLMHYLKNFLKAKTCYKNHDNLSTIDSILKSCPEVFKIEVFKIWPFVFHKLIVTVLEQYFPKQNHKVEWLNVVSFLKTAKTSKRLAESLTMSK